MSETWSFTEGGCKNCDSKNNTTIVVCSNCLTKGCQSCMNGTDSGSQCGVCGKQGTKRTLD
jgi:hypothetical protein